MQPPPVQQWLANWENGFGVAAVAAKALEDSVAQLPTTGQTAWKFWGDIDGSNMPADTAVKKLQDDIDALKQDLSQGSNFTVNMQMAMSPAQPWSSGYSAFVNQVLALPNSMEYTVNMVSGGSDSVNSAMTNYLNMMNLSVSQVYGDMAMHANTAATNMFFDPSMAVYALQTAQDNARNKFLQAYMGGNTSSGSSSASTTAGTTTNATTNTGVVLDFSVVINVGAGATAQDTAITLATQMDSQLASQILSHRSKIVNALKQMGLIK